MGVLKRFFKCVDTNIKKGCGEKWTSKAFQMEVEPCPNCLNPTKYEKTNQKMRDGYLLGQFKCEVKDKSGKVIGGCKREWMSAAAFKSKWQQCSRCKRKIKPHHVIEHNYEDIPTVPSSVTSELEKASLDESERTSNKGQANESQHENSQSHLPTRTQKYNRGHDMAACELCIELGENCVKYYEFIRNPEKEEAAKKKADELRPMLRDTMLEEQNAHLSYLTNFFGKSSLNDSERKAEIKRIHAEQPPSSGEEDDHPPRPPPKHRRRYRKPRTKKANKSD